LEVIWIDITSADKEFLAKIQQQVGWTLEHVKQLDNEPGFKVVPTRWVVEQTYACLGIIGD
jgi:hypothetical protein